MRITVLDTFTAFLPGEARPAGLSELGEVNWIEETDASRTAERIGLSDAVICNKSRMTREVMEQCPRLQYIGLMGTGFDQVDLTAAAEHGITVCNVPAYSANAVAQHTFALILNHYCRIADYARDCADGGWTEKRYFSEFGLPTHELAGKTIGLAGYGHIGRKVGEIARAFDMEVLAYTRHPERYAPYDKPAVTFVPLRTLLKKSDIVSLHCPLNSETHCLINRDTLSLMKPTALLVNTARGGLINEADLAHALRSGIIAAAAVDVLTEEPMSVTTPLRQAPHITVTPHIAWAPLETRRRLFDIVCDNLRCWMEGHPQNMVCPVKD